MKFVPTVVLTMSALAFSLSAAYSDTTTSNKGKETTERNASPSAPVKQDEERTSAHSQPDVPNPGGTTPRTTKKADPKSATSKKNKKDKESSSGGASAPSSALSDEKELAFQGYDLDGDGKISKAEAAGHAVVMTRFDRADRNRDGHLSRAEYANLDKPAARTAKAKSQAGPDATASR